MNLDKILDNEEVFRKILFLAKERDNLPIDPYAPLDELLSTFSIYSFDVWDGFDMQHAVLGYRYNNVDVISVYDIREKVELHKELYRK